MNTLPTEYTTHLQNNILLEVELVAKRIGLEKLYAYISTRNPGAALPYHSSMHMITVAHWCAKLYLMEEGVNLKVAVAAALLHDFDHSGGNQPDHVNIDRAVEGAKRFIELEPGCLTELEFDAVIKCIRCTVFPFVVEPTTATERVIRDADLLQSVTMDFESVLLDGLRFEMEVSRGHSISRVQMAEGQMQFMDNLHFYTAAGKALFNSGAETLKSRFSAVINQG